MCPRKERVTRLDYCQYLLVSQINYTLTNYAEHTEKFSHDIANRYLANDEIRPRLVWDNVKEQVSQTPYGFVVFDDTVVDKNFSRKIELVRRQYSGNARGVIKGIWVRLKQAAVETNRTIYRVKHDLLDDYLRQQLKTPSIKMCLA